jgi:hypothetical protein
MRKVVGMPASTEYQSLRSRHKAHMDGFGTNRTHYPDLAQGRHGGASPQCALMGWARKGRGDLPQLCLRVTRLTAYGEAVTPNDGAEDAAAPKALACPLAHGHPTMERGATR